MPYLQDQMLWWTTLSSLPDIYQESRLHLPSQRSQSGGVRAVRALSYEGCLPPFSSEKLISSLDKCSIFMLFAVLDSVSLIRSHSRYLRSLEDHANTRSGRNETTSFTEISSGGFRSPQHTSAETMTSDVTNPLVTQRPRLIQTGYLARPVYLGDASGIAFGMKLRESIRERDEFISLRPEHRYCKHPALHRKVSNSFELPEKNYALILIRLVKRFLGDTHHLNLGSAFLEKINTFYATRVEDALWVCRLFLLFALGELYSNKPVGASTESRIPGQSGYLGAVSHT
jgi:hypothetical protein